MIKIDFTCSFLPVYGAARKCKVVYGSYVLSLGTELVCSAGVGCRRVKASETALWPLREGWLSREDRQGGPARGKFHQNKSTASQVDKTERDFKSGPSSFLDWGRWPPVPPQHLHPPQGAGVQNA